MTKKQRNNKRPRKGKNAGKGQMIGTTLNHRAPIFRPLADRTKIRLEYTSTRNLLAVAAFQGFTYGAFTPGSFLPRYWPEMFNLYRYAFIHGITVTVEYANTGTNPFTVALGESNSTDAPLLNMAALVQTPRTIWKQVIPAGNHSVVSLSKSISGEAVLGHSVSADSDYFCQVATFPTVGFLPLLVSAHEPSIIGSPLTGILTTKYFLDIEFFTLKAQ